MIANSARGVRLLEAKDVNILPESIDAFICGTLTTGEQAMDLSAAKAAEFADLIQELRVSKAAVSTGRERGG